MFGNRKNWRRGKGRRFPSQSQYTEDIPPNPEYSYENRKRSLRDSTMSKDDELKMLEEEEAVFEDELEELRKRKKELKMEVI